MPGVRPVGVRLPVKMPTFELMLRVTVPPVPVKKVAVAVPVGPALPGPTLTV